MYRGFRLKNVSSLEDEYYRSGKNIYDEIKKQMKIDLREYLTEDKSLDAESLKNTFFPKGEDFDIFLSHSHGDEKKAIRLAGYFKEKFGLNTFIDSCLWGNVVDLLKEIDDKYSRHDTISSSYSYEKRNISTSHCHIMLSTSLTNMIDKIECFIFLDTEKTVKLVEGIEKTYSCWIYHELEISKIIRRTFPKRKRTLLEFSMEADTLVMEYNISSEHLTDIDFNHLKSLSNNNGKNSLDLWYEKF
ncbi:MAG: hypothetical protein ACRCU6_11230 [Fusobacteriaceae bacterium]